MLLGGQGGLHLGSGAPAAQDDHADHQHAEQQQGARTEPEQPGTLVDRRLVANEITVAVKGQVKADDSVFVFARAVGGPPMPLAVKRLTVADLPAEVSLSDADAMMPQLKLSGFPQVELVARVSRAGNAISGEWIGRGKPLSTAQSSAQALTIDGPDQPQAARA